jgi:ankyrin repeat protein
VIRPVELRGSAPIRLSNGQMSTTEDVWGMLTASRDGDLARVDALAGACPGLIHCEYNYTPPLHFAVREGHLPVVRYLVERGATLIYRTYPFGDSLPVMADDREHHDVAALLRRELSRRFPIADGIDRLLEAAAKGDLAGVQSELARRPELARGSNDTGDTALHRAAAGGHVPVVVALLDAGANADAVSGDGQRPVTQALHWRRRDPLLAGVLTGLLIGRGAHYNIYLGAAIGDDAFVRDALARDRSLANFEDSSRQRPLSAAASRRDLNMVRRLLAHGADPNLPEAGAPRGHALWWAVYQTQIEMAKALLEHGADPSASVESSGSVLFHAQKSPELMQLLLDRGARDESGDLDIFQRLVGDNALAEVEERLKAQPDLVHQERAYWSEGILSGPANSGAREMLDLLMRYGARVPDVSKWGRYYYFKHDDTAAFLIERGMNPNHMNWHHVTLLHDMAHADDIPKARLLLDHGAAIDAVDEEYRSTPLGLASRWGRREMVAFLLERGADPNRSGAPWATPLAWARKKAHAAIAADLVQAGAR